MLSKITQNTLKSISGQCKQNFSVRRAFYDFIYRDDKSAETYKATTNDPRTPLSGFRGTTADDVAAKYEVTKLSNGVTVVTESQTFPSQVDLGILLEVGTRDETTETTGSLLSIKNTYLKTILNTNETINYGVVQQSGGNFEMEYDQETAYFKANCLAHDATDIFSMVADCALEPRSAVAASVGIEKNQNTHKLESYLKTGELFNENVFKTAYGLKGLGLPLKGLRGNVKNLSSYTLQKFQLENITPNRIYVCAAGVESHQEFVDLVQTKLSQIPSSEGQKTHQREKSEYIGGEVRSLTEESHVTLALLFQSVPWTSTDLVAFNVASAILNNLRLKKNLLNKYAYFDHAEALNFHFTDSGLFGLRSSGSADRAKDILNHSIAELKAVATTVTADELLTAKAALKNSVLNALERQTDRLEETVKNIRTFNKVQHTDYVKQIDGVTADQVSKVVAKVLASTPTFVAQGGQVNALPTFDAIRNLLK